VLQDQKIMNELDPQTLLSQQFQALLTLFSKFFASFPHGTCALSVFRLYLALDGIYHPALGCILKQPDSLINQQPLFHKTRQPYEP